jgi:hypothetical protein
MSIENLRAIDLGHEVVARSLGNSQHVRGDLVGWVSFYDPKRSRVRLVASVRTAGGHDMRPTSVAGDSVRRPLDNRHEHKDIRASCPSSHHKPAASPRGLSF